MTPAEEPPPPPPEDPALPFTSQRRDASITEQWDVPSRTYRRFDCGVLYIERPFTDAENAAADTTAIEHVRRTRRAELLARLRTALDANQTYLDAVAAGTNPDPVVQTAALTRQVQALIRLLVGGHLLDSTGG